MKKISAGILVVFFSSMIVTFVALADTNDGPNRVSLYGWGDTEWKPLNADKATRAFETIDYPHHEIHGGSSFYFSEVISLNGTQNYMITTPATTKWSHWVYEIDTTGATTIELYETSDRSGDVAQTVYNRDRNSATTNTTTIHKGVTGGTTDGTKILYKSTVSRNATTSADSNERILKQNTKYVFKLTTGAAQTVSLVLSWYEHTNKT